MTTKLGDWIQQQLPENRLHLLRHQPSYFAKGREVQRLVAWLTDFGFLQQKLEAVGVVALINDFDLALGLGGEQEALRLIQGALRLSAHVLDKDNSKQLVSQLWGRLLSFSQPEVVALLKQAQQGQEKPWFRPLTTSFTPPGGSLIRTLDGHGGFVYAVAISPDGQWAVSGSYNNTLKVWNLATGTVELTLTGHRDIVLAVAISPDGQWAISGSYDETLKVWNLATGAVGLILDGHRD